MAKCKHIKNRDLKHRHLWPRVLTMLMMFFIFFVLDIAMVSVFLQSIIGNKILEGYNNSRKVAGCGVKFDLKSKILCEEFELVYSLFDVVSFSENDAKDICQWKYEGDYAVYNYPSWDECINMKLAFTNEKTRQEQYYKVLKAGEKLGYFRLEEKDNAIELSVGIVPDKCGFGNGDMLINLALAKISELYSGTRIMLTVRPFNRRAIRVYEKAGFKIVKEYYEDRYLVPGTMLLMEMISR